MIETKMTLRADTGDMSAAQKAVRNGWLVMGGTSSYSGLLQVLFMPQNLSRPNTPLDKVAERITGPLNPTDQISILRSEEGETAVLYEGQPGRGFRLLASELIDIKES